MFKMIILLPLILYSSLFASSINIKEDQWNLIGATSQINIDELNLSNGDIVWSYENDKWSCHFEGYSCATYESIESLDIGAGFWIKSNLDKTIEIADGSTEPDLIVGWNLITPVVSDIDNIQEYAQSNNISYIYTYENGSWKEYIKDNQTLGYEKITKLKKSQGVWVYKLETPKAQISIGDDSTNLENGNFDTVSKKSSDDIEDIWNISFKVDTSIDYSNFHIGVKFYKRENDGSDDIGEFVYRGLNLNNNTLSSPKFLIIQGTGDSGSGSTYFYSGYNPNDILSQSIVLKDNIITLKLGLIMKNQTMVSESTFKVVEDYDIVIGASENIIKDSKDIEVEIINKSKYDFTNGIEGRIEIR
jgi:hypothetical protein